MDNFAKRHLMAGMQRQDLNLLMRLISLSKNETIMLV